MERKQRPIQRCFLYLVILSLIIHHSCKDDTVYLYPFDFKIELDILRLIYYPNDSILMTFVLLPSGGKPPYSFNWICPGSFVADGPFTLNVAKENLIEVEITDANQTII